ATDTSGHLYISIIYSGIYGLVDNASLNGSDTGAATVAGSSLYGIANQDQAKLLTSDNSGNFYVLGNGSGDTLYFISTGPVKFPGAETVGTAENISAVVADNTEACTPTLTFTSPDTAFTGVITTSGTCSGMYQVAGSFTPVTLTYTPTATGFVASTLAVNDTTSSTSSAPQIVSSSGAAITISQGTWGAKLPGGGAFGSPAPDGHTGAINSKGVVVFGDSYGNQITLYNLVNGVTTLFGGTTTAPGVAGPYNGGGGVAIDHTDNLFMSSEYGSTIYKVAPNTDGSYGPWTADSNTNPLNAGGTAPVACVGGAADVTAGICAISLGAGNYNFGVAGMAVDTNGNLFFTSDNQASGSSGTYAPDTVWECKTTCLYGASSGNIVALYTEPIGGSGNPQLIPGSIALDSSDNVYFTDASVKGTEQSVYSDVYELPVNASNADGYANNPTLLVALPETCGSLSGCNYSTAITTVSVDANGDVFFGGPNDGSGHIGGLFKLAKNSGTLSSVPLAVSAEAPKTIVPGGNGNFYFVAYNGGDDTGYITLGSVAVTPVAQPSAPATVTNVWAIDNNADCYADQGNLTFTEAANDGFSAIETAGNNCTTLPFGSGVSFPVSVTFTPTASATGTVTTTITATNSNSGDTGTASVTGQAATAQPITGFSGIASSVVYGGGPYTLSATGGASGNPLVFSVDHSSTAAATATGTNGTTLTITGVGTVVIDINQAGTTTGSPIYAPGYLQVMITVTAAPQTITFAPTSPVTYTATPIALVATGGASGNPVTFTATGPGTITGTAAAPTLTLSGVGTVVVTASQAASTNGDYAAATPVVANIVVNAITQTITFAPTSPVIYTTTPIALVATGGASGNAVTFAVTSGPGTITGTATAPTLTLTGVGTVVVTASQAASTNGGYSAATPVAASIVVNADPQTITISASPTTVTAPSTSTITATASSGLPVTLAITTGSNIATLSGTTLTPTGTAFGNVTVTGTQTGNSIYAAATAATVTVLVNSAATVATPVITPASGTTLVIGSNNTVTIADTTANAVILYTTDGSSPLTSTTATKYTGAITLSTAGSVTVSAAATLLGDTPSAVVTATYTVTTVLPTFTISASPSSATVTNTTPASIAITVAPSVTFTAPITFACSGGQPNVGCTFSPASITPPATTTTTLTVSFGATAALRHGPNPFLPGGVTFAIALGFLGWKKRRNMLLALALIAGVVGLVQLTGCGGSTAPTVSTVTVTATGGGVTQTLPLTITVRQ
ncbi:MAG: FN3 associated domain-containing protein, partial [Terracidiphilus sp.]